MNYRIWSFSPRMSNNLFSSRNQFISKGDQGMDSKPEKQLLVASHTSCTCALRCRKQIEDGLVLLLACCSFPAAGHCVLCSSDFLAFSSLDLFLCATPVLLQLNPLQTRSPPWSWIGSLAIFVTGDGEWG